MSDYEIYGYLDDEPVRTARDNCAHEDVIQERMPRGWIRCKCRDCGLEWRRA